MSMEDVKDAAVSRIKHPLFGAIMFSFIVYNWPIWFFAFTGDASAQARIDSVSSYLCSHWFDSWFVPILAAIAYILSAPYVGKAISNYQFRAKLSEQIEQDQITEKSDLRDERVFRLIAQNADYARKLINDFRVEVYNMPNISTELHNVVDSRTRTIESFLQGMDKIPVSRETIQSHNAQIPPDCKLGR